MSLAVWAFLRAFAFAIDVLVHEGGGERRVHGGFVMAQWSAEHRLEFGGNTNVTRDGETFSAALAVHRRNHQRGFDILGGVRVT